MSTRHLVIIIVFVSAGICAGWAISRQSDPAGPLEIFPQRLKIDGRIPEPDVAQCTFEIRNQGRHPLTVIDAAGSCGCMEVAVETKDASGLPLVLKPGAAASVQVKITTSNRIGKQRTQVLIMYQVGTGVRREAMAYIDFDVQAGWRSVPHQVVAANMEECETRTEFVAVYDAFPDPGLELGEIRNSRPDLVRAEVARDDEGPQSPATVFYENNEAAVLSRRFRVKLDLTTPREDGQVSARITLVPTDPNRLPLVVPIVLQRKRPDLSVQPARIAVPLDGSPRERRYTILCRTERFPVDEVEVTAVESDLVKVREGAKLGERERLFELTVSCPDSADVLDGRVEFEVGGSRAEVYVEFVGGARSSVNPGTGTMNSPDFP